MDQIPVLSLAQAETQRFCEQLRSAFAEYGFVALRDHGLKAGLRDEVFCRVEQFFSADESVKMGCHRPGTGGARGFTPFGIEVAKDQTVPDLKEFFHLGRWKARPRDPNLQQSSEQRSALDALPKNVFPENMPEFQAALCQMYEALDEIGGRVLRAIARGLELAPDYFDTVVDVGNSLLRALHYPPLGPNESGAARAAAHEDINLITLLIGSDQPGLEVLSRSGAWIPAPGGDELIICNVGDMLQRLSNHVLPSTTHRVINPPAPWSNQSRYSLPFFLHPNSDFLIKSLPSCVSPRNPDRYPEPILADDFLKQRLREIGLI